MNIPVDVHVMLLKLLELQQEKTRYETLLVRVKLAEELGSASDYSAIRSEFHEMENRK
jgi:hypothetical protein